MAETLAWLRIPSSWLKDPTPAILLDTRHEIIAASDKDAKQRGYSLACIHSTSSVNGFHVGDIITQADCEKIAGILPIQRLLNLKRQQRSS